MKVISLTTGGSQSHPANSYEILRIPTKSCEFLRNCARKCNARSFSRNSQEFVGIRRIARGGKIKIFYLFCYRALLALPRNSLVGGPGRQDMGLTYLCGPPAYYISSGSGAVRRPNLSLGSHPDTSEVAVLEALGQCPETLPATHPTGCFHESFTRSLLTSPVHNSRTQGQRRLSTWYKLSSPEASLLIRSYSFNPPACFHIRSAEVDRWAA